MELLRTIGEANPSLVLLGFALLYAIFWFLGRYGYLLALLIIVALMGTLLALPGGEATIKATRNVPSVPDKAACVVQSFMTLSIYRDRQHIESLSNCRKR